MNKKRILASVVLVLVFISTVSIRIVLAERSKPELEFMIENARKDINMQEAIVNSLRKRYEAILSRKRDLQNFLEEENRKAGKVVSAQSKPLVRPEKPKPGLKPIPDLKAKERSAQEARVKREEKERQGRENESAKRKTAQDEVLRQREKVMAAALVPAPAVEKKKTAPAVDAKDLLQAKKREESLRLQLAKQEAELLQKEQKIKQLQAQGKSQKSLGEEKTKEQKAKENLICKQQQAELVKKQEKEKELLSKKLEKERLLVAAQQQRLINERECQMRLLLEADKNAKHERYVSQLGQLLSRQNYLLEETRKLESQVHQEEETLRDLEKTRQDLIRRLLENS